jgi:hypothetical protein
MFSGKKNQHRNLVKPEVLKFVAKKGVTGPLRDRDGKNRKYAVLVYIQKENPKNRKSYRYGTVTEP